MPRVGIAVRDMDRAVALFRDGFGIPTYEFPWATEQLGARMAFASARGAGSVIELIAPSDAGRSHSQVFLKFLERRGEGLYALMMNAEDPNAEAELLASRGLPVMPLMPEAGGRDLHPRDTCGVLIRIYPTESHLTVEPDLDRELGPLETRVGTAGLGGIARVLVAVRDLDAAVAVYRDRLGLDTVVRPEEWGVSVRQAIVTPPEGARIELLAPTRNAGPIAGVLRERGEGMFALVLESEDLGATVETLRARGVPVHPAPDESGAWHVDRTAACGVLFRLEVARSPEGGPPWS